MFRSMARSLIFLMLLCAVGGYLFYLKTGSFPSPGRIFTSTGGSGGLDLRRLSEMPALNSVDPDKTEQNIQKWQDENGYWHFSNEQER